MGAKVRGLVVPSTIRRRAWRFVLLFLFLLPAVYHVFKSPESLDPPAQDEMSSEVQCPPAEQPCLTQKKIHIMMSAVPHTASSTTDRMFAVARQAWKPSASLDKRGFACPAGRTITQLGCPGGCVLRRLEYNSKKHSAYNKLAAPSNIVFTTLREPEQFVLSQYKSRFPFDAVWSRFYPEIKLHQVDDFEWVDKAWWRYNLFTKMLATNSSLIWTGDNKKPIVPSKEESDRENELGKDSEWLKLALYRLKQMPFFGLMHRLTESFELFGFSLCIQVNQTSSPYKKTRPVNPTLAATVEKHFRLDRILLTEAEIRFDELVDDMRRKKEQGILCDMSRVLRLLREPETELGLKCIE